MRLLSITGLCAGLGLVLLPACAGQRALVEERRESQEAVEQAEAALQAVPEAEALLKVATLRDGRFGAPELVKLARHPAERVRREALRALGLIGDPRTLLAMTEGLDDGEPAVRAEAATALSMVWGWHLAAVERISVQATIEAHLLQRLIVEDDEAVLAAAAFALGHLELGGDELWELTEHDSAAVRRAAWEALGRRAKAGALGEGWSPEQVARLAAGVDRDGVAAAWALAQAGGEGVEAAVLARLDGADEAVGAWLLRALGHGAGVEGRAALKRAEPGLQWAAALAAAKLQDAEVLAALTEPGVLATTVPALAALGVEPEGVDEELLWTARAALPERAQHVAEAVAALGGVADGQGSGSAPSGGEREMPANRGEQAPSAPDPGVRAALYGFLATVPSEQARAALLASESDPAARLAQALAVAARDDEATEGWLLERLDGDDPVLGAIAAEALGGRPGGHLLPRLEAAFFAHPEPADWERRLAVVEALLQAERPPAEPLLAALKDPSPHVRVAAYRGLNDKLGRSEAVAPPQKHEAPAPVDAFFGVADVVSAQVRTSRGELTLTLYPKLAPATVANFAELAEQGFYDGLAFHRFVPGFVVQGGDPDGTGWGGPGWTIRDEFSRTPFGVGTLGMARAGRDTAGSQWFVTLGRHPHLDGHYTAFGQLISGFDVLRQLRAEDRIESITIQRASP